MSAKRKIEIRKVSRFGIWITLFLVLAFVFLIIQGENEFFAMNESTEQYIQAEKAVQQFEKGADYLTEHAVWPTNTIPMPMRGAISRA